MLTGGRTPAQGEINGLLEAGCAPSDSELRKLLKVGRTDDSTLTLAILEANHTGKQTVENSPKLINISLGHNGALNLNPIDPQGCTSACAGTVHTIGNFNSMALPFEGTNLPVEVLQPSPALAADGPQGSRIFRFDTSPARPLGVGGGTFGGTAFVPLRGYAYFDPVSALVLKIVADGYDFPERIEPNIGYLHTVIIFGKTDEGRDSRWAPKFSLLELGPGLEDLSYGCTRYLSANSGPRD